jgi:membrane protein
MTSNLRNNPAAHWIGHIIRSFVANDCLLRAAALSYTSILSLVPFLALAFALLKGFGVPHKLAPLILEKVAAGSHEIVAQVLLYIDNTNMKSLGAIGLVALLVTVIGLLGEIEAAFNAIWGIKEPRPWNRKFSEYLSVVLSGPLLLFAATSVTTSLQSQVVVQGLLTSSYLGPLVLALFRFVPYLSIWVALIFLFLFIPNTRVRFSSAVVGGIIAGTIWQAAQWCYLYLQIYMTSYNAIYGTLAILPIFMIWIYTSWIIVLVGVEIVYAHQHRTLLTGGPTPQLSQRERTALSLALAGHVARAFMNGSTPPTTAALAAEAAIPPLLANELLGTLETTGILVRTAEPQAAYLPAHDPGGSLVSELLEKLAGHGDAASPLLPLNLAPLFTSLDQATAAHLQHFTLAELALHGWPQTTPADFSAAGSALRPAGN